MSTGSASIRTWIGLGCAGLLLAGSLAAVAATAAGPRDALADEAAAGALEVQATGPTTHAPVVDPMKPIVTQLPDGTLIQRTPSEDQFTADYNHPAEYVPSNTYFVNADAKGCNACHTDLAETVANLPYAHFDMRSKIGTDTRVDQCQDCHALRGRPSQTVEGEFGALIHGIHSHGEADCWNCHVASDYTNGEMAVWDNVKYDYLRGFTDVAADDLGDGFAYRQDEIFDADQDFTVQWYDGEHDEQRADAVEAGEEPDPEVFDTWTITISGMVDEEVTWSLPELIAEAPSETRIMKHLCAHNPTNGPYVYQGEWTGIPIQWLLDQVDIQEGATTVTFVAPDGASTIIPLEECYGEVPTGTPGMLCYELNGERLNLTTGYPTIYMAGTRGANDERREVSEIIIGNESYDPAEQHGNHEYTKPNVGLFDFTEGQILQAGQSYTFHGYIDSYNQDVLALEISMDRGETWKRFDFEGLQKEQLTTWTYEFTPEEGAYTIYVRGVKSYQGGEEERTDHILKMMFVAYDEIPEPDVVLE